MQRQEIMLVNSELKRLIQEACSALAQLDAGRLEELALSCRALNQSQIRQSQVRQSRIAQTPVGQAQVPVRWADQDACALHADLFVLRNILKATKANLDVLDRLLGLQKRPLVYDSRTELHMMRSEDPYGDN